jgi:hypothetical protein
MLLNLVGRKARLGRRLDVPTAAMGVLPRLTMAARRWRAPGLRRKMGKVSWVLRGGEELKRTRVAPL